MISSAYVLRSTLPVITAAIAIGLLTSCSRPVAVQAPTVGADCEPLLAAAPIRLLGELQRETTPRDSAAIAWGDPPIVFVCGAATPTAADAQVITVEGVDWVAEQTQQGTVFTTLDFEPTLQMRVPAEYRPEIDAVVEVTSALGVP